MTSNELDLRARPRQARSQATMDRLLEAAEELLVEVGVDGFNTNLLAKRAGVGVRAIYRYFPNKWAVLVELGNRSYRIEREWVDNLEAFREGNDWEAAIDRAIEGFYTGARRHPGYSALRAASRISPQLREVDVENSRRFQSDVALSLRAMGVQLDGRHLAILSQVIIESSGRLLDLALQADPAEAELIVAELKHMIRNLLRDYIPA